MTTSTNIPINCAGESIYNSFNDENILKETNKINQTFRKKIT